MANIFRAPPIGLTYFITVNGVANVKLGVNPELHGYSWQGNATGSNLENYTISNGKVIWNNGTILQYNGVDVLPTDDIINNGVYTTRANEPTTGTIKFGSTAPTKYYLGNKAVDRIYMGTVLLYKKAIVYTLPTALELGGGTNAIVAEGYNVTQGDIEVSSSVYNAITALNNGGSLTDFGNTCGLTIPSTMKAMIKMGVRLEIDPSNTNPESTENGTYLIYLTIPQLVKTMSNIGYIEFDYTNNTATYTTSKNEDIDAENHQLMIEVAKIDGTRLVQVCYEVSEGETWLLNAELTFGIKNWSHDINFTSNGNSYSKFSYNLSSPIDAYLVYGTTNVYEVNSHVWTNNAYRTVIFATAPTGDLLTWLQANGVKQ